MDAHKAVSALPVIEKLAAEVQRARDVARKRAYWEFRRDLSRAPSPINPRSNPVEHYMAVGPVATPATVQLPPSIMSAPMPPCAPAVPPSVANAPSAGAPRALPLAAAVALARPVPRAPAPPSPKRRATPHPVVTIDLNDSSSSSSSGEGSPSSPVYSPAASDEEDVEDGAARWADGVWKWE